MAAHKLKPSMPLKKKRERGNGDVEGKGLIVKNWVIVQTKSWII